MDIKAVLHNLLPHYIPNRRATHNAAAINGVQHTPEAVLIVATFNHLTCRLHQTGWQQKKIVTLSQLDELRGTTRPLALDSSAVVAIGQAALKEIERLEAENFKLQGRYNRAVGEIAWLRLPLWKKVAKYLRYPSIRRWRREESW